MTSSQEHEIVPAIRDWLSATADLEVATGVSRGEARQGARELLFAIEDGRVTADQVEVNDDLKDVLWAMVEELDEKPLGDSRFEECDRVYAFVTALSLETDPFGERDEILHRVARIGWASAPDGLGSVIKLRRSIWEHGDELRHREVCASADQLPARIDALLTQQAPLISDIREFCAQLLKLANVRPRLVAPAVIAVETFLADRERRIGWLDDREYLKGVSALVAGITGRQLGRLGMAEEAYQRAETAFRRTADVDDLDRVKVERLAVVCARWDHGAIRDSAPDRIKGLSIPRERIKAQLILANALMGLSQLEEARLLLQAVRQNDVIENEPALKAWMLTMTGTALSYLGRDPEAVAEFESAAAVLAKFFHPLQMGGLVGAFGTHLAKSGKPREAIALYESARETFREAGHAQQVGYTSVLRAELLMLTGANEEAEAALLVALPLIEKFELQREGVAAVVLLREAMTKRRTDVKAIQVLRDQLRRGLH